jgi:anti-sigma regulatory factor (Ser/Thr protein kinase)
MEELALHLLDIAENSLAAGATEIGITVLEDAAANLLWLEVADNGRGMDPEEAERALDPFVTSRRTRRVGLGLSLLDAAARRANGRLEIHSRPGEGTRVVATFQLGHIDRQPLGDVAGTLVTLMAGRMDLDLSYTHRRGERVVTFSTDDLRRLSHGAAFLTAQTLRQARELLTAQEDELTTIA